MGDPHVHGARMRAAAIVRRALTAVAVRKFGRVPAGGVAGRDATVS
ncbi:hypothetical protein [Salinispora fenicalii]|nr:hypothetical protein [Salinispora fenicalii]